MSSKPCEALFTGNGTEIGVVADAPTAMSCAHNGSSGVLEPVVAAGASVGPAEDGPEIDEMLSAVSTTTLELHELESLVLDDNQQLFGQEVTLTTDALASSSDQLVQLDHCYAQSPLSALLVTEPSHQSKNLKRGSKRSADDNAGASPKQLIKQGGPRHPYQQRHKQQIKPRETLPQQQVGQPIDANYSEITGEEEHHEMSAMQKEVCPTASRKYSAPSVMVSKDDLKESPETATLETALTPQELDAVSAAVARLHSSEGLALSNPSENTKMTAPVSTSSLLLKSDATDTTEVTATKRASNTPIPTLRPSRKSKEKFQRSLERKRKMGKNIEDYVSEESDDNTVLKRPSPVAIIRQPIRRHVSPVCKQGIRALPTCAQRAPCLPRLTRSQGPLQRVKKVPPASGLMRGVQSTSTANKRGQQQDTSTGEVSRTGLASRALRDDVRSKDRRSHIISSKAAAGVATRRRQQQQRSQATPSALSSARNGRKGSLSTRRRTGPPRSADDSDSNSDNDPEKLWCLCRKPYNNQFMIACDSCENWFHGKCVGVTKAEGARMEKTGHEWFCSHCRRKGNGEPHSFRGSGVTMHSSAAGIGRVKSISAVDTTVPLIDSTVLPSSYPSLPSTMLGNYTVLGQCAYCKQAICGEATCNRFCNAECTSRHVIKYLPAIIERAEKEGLEVRVSMVEISTGKAINLVNATVDGTEKWLCRKPTFQINPNQASAIRRPVPKIKPLKAEVKQGHENNRNGGHNNSSGISGDNKTSTAASSNRRMSNDNDSNKKDTDSAKATSAQERTSLTGVSEVSSVIAGSDVSTTEGDCNSKCASTSTVVDKNAQSVATDHDNGSQASGIDNARATSVLTSTSNAGKASKSIPNKQDTGTRDGDMQFSDTQLSDTRDDDPGAHNPPLAQALNSDVKVIARKSSPTLTQKVRSEARRKSLTRGDSADVVCSSLTSKDNKDDHKTASKSQPNQPNKEVEISASQNQESSLVSEARRNGVNALARIVRERCEKEETKAKKTADGDSDEKCDAITRLAQMIDCALWDHCGGVAKNYRIKFRSLCFNMKDPKNELWRRVVNGEIKPAQLVKMGPNELSTEMARWRERESQHTLELYKKEAAINITDQDTLQLLTDAAPLAGDDVRKSPLSKARDDRKSSDTKKGKTSHRSHNKECDTPSDKVTDRKECSKRDDKPVRRSDGHRIKGDEGVIKDDKDRHRRRDSSGHDVKESRSRRDRSLTTKGTDSSMQRKTTSPDEERGRRSSPRRETEGHGVNRDIRQLDKAQRIIERVKAFERRSTSLASGSTISAGEENSREDNDLSADGVSVGPAFDVCSTVSSSVLNFIWRGIIRMDPSRFPAIFVHAAGPADTGFENDIPGTIVICGNIQPFRVKDYLTRLRHTNKDIVVVRVMVDSEYSEKYDDIADVICMLKPRNRLGVVKEMKQTTIKDFYMLPLDPHEKPPDWFPYINELETSSEACLLGLVICHNKKKSPVSRQPTQAVSSPVIAGITGPSTSSYEPTAVVPGGARLKVDINSIDDAERTLAERASASHRLPQQHSDKDCLALGRESSLSMLSSVATQQRSDVSKCAPPAEEAYDPEVEWA